jgi:non-ribosomal peptide synthetase component E (peptide arylation enzyme)
VNAIFDPAAIGQRVAYLAHSVVGQFSRTDRDHPAVRFDTRAIGKLQDVANAWHGAETLSQEQFRQRFFDHTTSDATVERLRLAIQRATTAKTYDDLGAASKDLAAAMSMIGLDRWPGQLTKLGNHAAAASQPAR